MKKSVAVFTLYLFSFSIAYAQSHLYLKPLYIVHLPTCYVKDRSQADPSFGINRFNMTGSLGLMLEWDINERWGISAGITEGQIGFDFQVDRKNDFKFYGFSSLSYSKIPVVFTYTWKDLNLIRLYDSALLHKWGKKLGNPYLLLCKVQWIAGASFDGNILNDSEGIVKSGSAVAFVRNPAMNPYSYSQAWYKKRATGVSLIAGVSFQFHHKGKDRLQISILYNQGLFDRIEVPVNYRIYEEVYSALVASRGSGLMLQASYPIRLASFKNKKYNIKGMEIGD